MAIDYNLEITNEQGFVIKAKIHDDNTIEIEEWESVTTANKTKEIYNLINICVHNMKKHNLTKFEVKKP